MNICEYCKKPFLKMSEHYCVDKFFSKDRVLELKVSKMIEKIVAEKLPCIEKLQIDNETMKQKMQIMTKKVAELEKELVLVKSTQMRRYRKTIQDILKNLGPPEISWLDYAQQWRDQMGPSSLEQVFAANSFVDTFTYELKRIQPIVIVLSEPNPIPETVSQPIICFHHGKQKTAYVWEQDAWIPFQYIHVKKLITHYIYQIRELWMIWQTASKGLPDKPGVATSSSQLLQEENKNLMNESCDKYNSYISKPVSILYNESYKYKWMKIILK